MRRARRRRWRRAPGRVHQPWLSLCKIKSVKLPSTLGGLRVFLINAALGIKPEPTKLEENEISAVQLVKGNATLSQVSCRYIHVRLS